MMRLIASSTVSSSSSSPAPAERRVQRRGRLAALAGVRLVDDDREAPVAVLRADIVEDERELLDRRDDDLLAVLDELAQIARVLGMARRSRRPGRTA